jgi:hypothetical protein
LGPIADLQVLNYQLVPIYGLYNVYVFLVIQVGPMAELQVLSTSVGSTSWPTGTQYIS